MKYETYQEEANASENRGFNPQCYFCNHNFMPFFLNKTPLRLGEKKTSIFVWYGANMQKKMHGMKDETEVQTIRMPQFCGEAPACYCTGTAVAV